MFGVRSRNEFAIGDTTIAIAGEMPGMGLAWPKTLRGAYSALVIDTDDADAI